MTSPPRERDDREPLPELLTVEDVAQLLRTTARAIYSQVARGQLPGVIRVGRRVLFDRKDLLQWLRERRAVSPMENRR